MTATAATSVLTGGLADPPVDAARAFRRILNALARPGRIETLEGAMPPAPLSVAAGTLLLTLADATTPIFLAPSHDVPELRNWLTFHCGALFCGPGEAVFALGNWEALQPLARFPVGLPDYPDRAATLIVEVPALLPPNARLTGPGIRGEAHLALPSVAGFAANGAMYPLGFDAFLTAGIEVAGLPRSTRVEAI